MAQRGGSVLAQVRYGRQVHSPLAALGTARVLASLECIEALRYADFLAPDGLAVVSSQRIIPVTVSSGAAKYPADAEERLRRTFPRLIHFDALEGARAAGNPRASNVVVVGALSTGLDLPPAAWEQAIRRTVKKDYIDLNLRAFQAGVRMALQEV